MYMMPVNHMMRNAMNEMFGENFMRPFFAPAPASFRVDVKETETGYEIHADLPGVDREHIDVTTDHDILTIKADFGNETRTEKEGYTHIERRTGSMTRSFNVKGINTEAITADYENGVLKLTLPKQQEVDTVKHIAIGGTTTAA